MSNKNEVVTPANEKLYNRCTQQIRSMQGKVDGYARTIAGCLTRLADTKSYEVGGYTNIYDYAEKEHNISRGTTSDAINVFRKFALPDHSDIAEEWKKYAWSALIMLKKYDDPAEIVETLGVDENTTRKELKAKLDAYESALATTKDPEPEPKTETNPESSTVEQSEGEEAEANEANEPLQFALPVDATNDEIERALEQLTTILKGEQYKDIVIRRYTRTM